MCTAAAFQTKDFYFGRTLDYECSYGECVTVTPRRYPFSFRHMGRLDAHYAMIGMAHVADGYPLYYDAVNEAGLGMAGLNFVGNAQYAEVQEGKENVAQFELIPWILGRCATVREARARLDALNLVGTPFSERYPAAQLHWLLADKDEAVVIESMADGLHVYDDPAGVLTNNPPFPQQLFNLNNYCLLYTSSSACRGRCSPCRSFRQSRPPRRCSARSSRRRPRRSPNRPHRRYSRKHPRSQSRRNRQTRRRSR